MAQKLINLIGKKFARLLVVDHSHIDSLKKHNWKCQCDCGAVKIVRGNKLTCGEVMSCGCLKKERQKASVTTHGKSRTPIWYLWRGIRTRCLNKNDKSFKNYGGRGIRVHPAWISDFAQFLDDLPEKPQSNERMTIDRIDNEKGYEPGNLRWATYTEQSNNRRSNVWIEVCGQRKTQAQWDRELGKSQNYVREMSKKWGVSKEDVIKRAI